MKSADNGGVLGGSFQVLCIPVLFVAPLGADLSSFMPSAAPKTPWYPSSLTAIANMAAGFLVPFADGG